MVGWHHEINGHEFEQTQGNSEGQGSLACCSLWGLKESDMTQQLNNKKKKFGQEWSSSKDKEVGSQEHGKLKDVPTLSPGQIYKQCSIVSSHFCLSQAKFKYATLIISFLF